MSPHEERQLGEQLGRMEQGIQDLQHRFSRIERQLEDKVSTAWSKAHDKQADERDKHIDSLEASRDKIRGVLIALTGLNTVALLVVGLLTSH